MQSVDGLVGHGALLLALPLLGWAIGDCHGCPVGTWPCCGCAIQGSATGARCG